MIIIIIITNIITITIMVTIIKKPINFEEYLHFNNKNITSEF